MSAGLPLSVRTDPLQPTDCRLELGFRLKSNKLDRDYHCCVSLPTKATNITLATTFFLHFWPPGHAQIQHRIQHVAYNNQLAEHRPCGPARSPSGEWVHMASRVSMLALFYWIQLHH